MAGGSGIPPFKPTVTMQCVMPEHPVARSGHGHMVKSIKLSVCSDEGQH